MSYNMSVIKYYDTKIYQNYKITPLLVITSCMFPAAGPLGSWDDSIPRQCATSCPGKTMVFLKLLTHVFCPNRAKLSD